MFELSPKFGIYAVELLCKLEAVVLPNIISGTKCGMYGFSKQFTLNIYKIGLIQTSMNLKKPGIFPHAEI